MRATLPLSLVLASALALPAWAQTAGKRLDLTLPPGAVPARSTSAAPPGADSPGVYYGDTSGRMDTDDAAALEHCDDAAYNQAQLHGSVGMGVVAGSHVAGNYQGGTVNLSKAFGSCDHPTGGVSISIGGTTGHFHRH